MSPLDECSFIAERELFGGRTEECFLISLPKRLAESFAASSIMLMKLVSLPVRASKIWSLYLKSSFSSCFWKSSFFKPSLTWFCT